MKLIDILKSIDVYDYDFESDTPVKDYDIRPESAFSVCLRFMLEEETWVTVPITHPILRQYYYAEVESFHPMDEDTLAVWLKKEDWFPAFFKKEGTKEKDTPTATVKVSLINKKPSNCSECLHCQIAYSKKDSHQGEARCLLSPTARTEGKVITWAMDTCEYPGGPITPGIARLEDNLKHRQRHVPKWCPLYKEDKNNE